MATIQFPNGNVYEGEVRFGKPHGQGKMTFADGGQYVGDFKSGKFHGSGNRVWPDGDIYRGQWKDGQYHGKGKFSRPDGSSSEGTWKNGSFQDGVCTPPRANYMAPVQKRTEGLRRYDRELLDDDECYEGEYLEDTWDGQGKFTFYDGSTYEGAVIDGTFGDFGRRIYENGDVYVGQWDQYDKEGLGVLLRADGAVLWGQWRFDEFVDGTAPVFLPPFRSEPVSRLEYKRLELEGAVYEGECLDGVMHGLGRYIFDNGDVYFGNFQDGLFHGWGLYAWADGDVYMGEWENDLRHGRGCMIAADGTETDGIWENGGFANSQDRYEGQKKDGLPDGDGVMYYENGEVYSGEWTAGKRDGVGMLTRPDGSGLKGSWFDDEFSDGWRLHPGSGNEERKLTLPYGEYVGDIKDMEPHGWGIMDYSDGKHYEGDWEKGLEHGYGVMTHPDGGFEDGQWEKGKFIVGNSNVYDEDEAEEHWQPSTPAGDGISENWHRMFPGTYQGGILDGLPEGYGVMRFDECKEFHAGSVFTASWLEGVPTCGVLRTPGDNITAGNFWWHFYRNGELISRTYWDTRIDGPLDPDGVDMLWAESEGLCYDSYTRELTLIMQLQIDGDTVERKFTCPAERLYYDNGDEYFGEVTGNEPNGYGIMLYADGSCYWGAWVNGMRHGFGDYFTSEGNMRHGEWDNDENWG